MLPCFHALRSLLKNHVSQAHQLSVMQVSVGHYFACVDPKSLADLKQCVA